MGGWNAYLDRGEKLIWEGAPLPGMRFKPSDIFISLFGTFFFAFALFWTGMAMAVPSNMGGFDLLFPFFGLPFMVVGAYMMFGRFFWEAYVRGKTRYALTSKRAIVAQSAWRRTLKSYPIDADTRIEFQPGDAATLYFAQETKRGRKGATYTVKHGFEYIRNGDEVYRMMRQIQQRETS